MWKFRSSHPAAASLMRRCFNLLHHFSGALLAWIQNFSTNDSKCKLLILWSFQLRHASQNMSIIMTSSDAFIFFDPAKRLGWNRIPS